MRIISYKILDKYQYLELIRQLPTKELIDKCSVLMVRKFDEIYLIKCRQGCEDKIKSEDFKVITRYDLNVGCKLEGYFNRLSKKIDEIMPDNQMIIYDM